MSKSDFFHSDEGRVLPRVASVGAALSVVMLAGVVWMALAAGAARAKGTGTTVTFKHDVHLPNDSRERLPWHTNTCYRSSGCSQRVQIENIDRRGGFKPPVWVHEFQSVDLGAVEDFEVTDSYEKRGESFTYFYVVSVQGGDGPVTLTLTELHRRTYSSAFRVDVRCREWRSSTGSLPVSC